MTTTEKSLLGAGLIALAGFVALAFVWPKYGQITELRTALQNREELIAGRQEALTKVAQLYQDYTENEDQIALISRIVPAQKNTAEIISAIDNIAIRSRVSIANLQITEAKKNSNAKDASTLNSVKVNLEINGDYYSVKLFLQNLEKNLRIFDIETLNMAVEEKTGLIATTITGQAYFLK